MKRIDSDALEVLTRVLGLTGSGAQITELLDGQVNQNLDIGPIVRRGRTISQQAGLFTALLRNVHPGADSIITTMNPYAAPGAIGPFPDPMPLQFELWLLGATTVRAAGAGEFTIATLWIDPLNTAQAFGTDNLGNSIIDAQPQPLVRWDSMIAGGTKGHYGLTEEGLPSVPLGLRIPRDARLSFSTTSSAAMTADCQLMIGMFPIALGQDGRV